MGGQYYGHYYGAYYPYESRALTVVRREHLKDPHISANALRGDSLRGLNKMSLTSQSLSLRPAGTKISVEPMNGNRVMLRNDRSTGLSRDGRISREAVGRTSATTGPRAIRGPDAPAKTQGTTRGTATKPQSGKSPSKGEKSSGSARTGSSSGRNIRKKDGSSAPAASSVGGYQSDSSIAGTGTRVGTTRNVNGYPSSPRIKAPASSYGDGGSGRARTFSGPYSRPSSGGSVARPSTSRSSGSSGRSGGARVGSSSGRSSGSSSRGSSSRGSGSASRGSSSGSRGSSGGSARRK